MKKQIIILGIFILLICVGLSGCEEVPDEFFEEMVIVSFTVEPSIIDIGETANLSWVVTGSDTTVTIDNEIGNVSLVGHRIILPNETVTYTLTAKNLTSLKTATTQVIVKNLTEEDEPEDNESDGNGNGGVTNPIAIIDTSMGTIKVELYEDKVPNTCENFINYANDGFYDGLVFHRVIDDFMIQGGGFYPNGTKKDTNDPIDLEINEEVRHVDGAIAMARTNDPNSATSQFFINDGPQPNLEPGGVDPNGYAAFGVVIDGMDVVRAIALLDPEHTTTKYGMQNWPIDDVIINSITIENQ